MLEYALNTSTNVFCQWEGLQCVAVLRSICQASWKSTTTTMGRNRTTKWRRHVSWVEGFALCFRSVHGWVGMHVEEKVCLYDAILVRRTNGLWRKMSRAWPSKSTITTSSVTTWPGYQESAWGAAQARQERVVFKIVRKGHCCRATLESLMNTSTNVLYQYCPRQEGIWSGSVLMRICQAT